MKTILKLFFTLAFIISTSYVVLLETERYQSNSLITIRDLSQKQATSSFDMILSQTSPVMQDSKLLELYIRSGDMFSHLDTKFNLSSYYSGTKIDVLRRLSKESPLPFYKLTKENLLEEYNKDLFIIYDTASTALQVGFAHADPKIAQAIVESIIEHSSDTLNRLERENANVALHFLEKQVDESKITFIHTIKKMIEYQNEHNTIDPNLDVQSKSTILANLEGDLIKKTVEYQSAGKFMIKNSAEQKIAQNTIVNLKKEIKKVKQSIAGSDIDSKELNEAVFDFELLKNDMDFSKEIYRQSLVKLEELRTQVNQNIKNLLVINKPSLAEKYTYPDKTKKILTLFIILVFLYSILISIITLLRDHRD
ncbi:MAG TPA: hypothetical protein EYH42_05245 [Sulfurovum sp.]|nr:hypothetical protein [Sulfurovum sp.]